MTPAPVTPRGSMITSFGRASHFALSLSMTFTAWAFVAGLAIAAFTGQVTWSGQAIVQKELLGFGYAFSMAGTITGFVALAALGERGRAIGFLLAGCVTLAATGLALRLLILHLTAPSPGWAQSEWEQAIERLVPSLILGALIALLASGPVVAIGLLARRMALWTFGVLIAIVVPILGLWVLPAILSHLSGRAFTYIHGHYGPSFDEALRGAAIGAGPGALAGAIVVVLMARWIGPRSPCSIDHPTGRRVNSDRSLNDTRELRTAASATGELATTVDSEVSGGLGHADG